jgi:hypothetical protein
MDLRAFRQREAGVVLDEHLPEQLHRRQNLVRIHMLLAHDQDAVFHEGPVQAHLRVGIDRLGQVDPGDFRAGMVRQFAYRYAHGRSPIQCSFQRSAAASSDSRASTHTESPPAASSRFQNGALVFSQSIRNAVASSAACR